MGGKFHAGPQSHRCAIRQRKAAEGHPAEVMDMSFANQALAAEFLVNYKFQNEETRQKIRERIKQELPARNHALLVEMLWEFSEGTDRNRWLHTLLQELWHYNSQDEDRRKEFLFSVVHLEGIPKEVREPIRMENSVMENSVIAMQERALV